MSPRLAVQSNEQLLEKESLKITLQLKIFKRCMTVIIMFSECTETQAKNALFCELNTHPLMTRASKTLFFE